MSRNLTVAVIGSGIAGLSAAWLLSQRHRVTLFEQNNRAGGHSNTVDVMAGSKIVPVDTGFIVYNTASYPNLIALFNHLDVQTAPTSMGFAVSLDDGALEYSGDGLRGLFGQPSNLWRPAHWRMLVDVLRFFRESRALLNDAADAGPTLGEYLSANGYSETFIARHILPMAAAIWSTPAAEVLNFPAVAFVRFFDNHGLLQVRDRPEWRTVVGGSRSYVDCLLAAMQGRVELNAPVRTVMRTADGVTLMYGRERRSFDACVIATHADDALALLDDADADERRLLGAIRYVPNKAVLHSDASFMPRRRRLWESWNYLGSRRGADADLSVTYWMNRLQRLGSCDDHFVTLNPTRNIASATASFNYSHPLFDHHALAAQRELWMLQGRRNTWYCGSYFGFGFHEDALQAGIAAAEAIGGVRRPWNVANESSRIHINSSDLRAASRTNEAAA